MFTFESVVDTGVKTAKQAINFVQDEKIKKELGNLVDAQAEYSKTLYNTTVDITKNVMENYAKVDLSKFDWTKGFVKAK